MNVSSIQPNAVQPAQIASVPSVEAKRAALQTALLRKSLESQQQQTDQMVREAEGKGRLVDIRV